jgi:hypothetical protein
MSTPLSQARTQFPRLAEAAVERARLTVVPRRTQKAPRVPFVSLVSLLLVTGVVGLLLFNTSMQQSSFVATSMEEQATVLAAKEESLQMQLEQLRDPQRVATRAKRMGMVPASAAFVWLSDGDRRRCPPSPPGCGSTRCPPRAQSLRPDPVIVEIERPKAVRRPRRATVPRPPRRTATTPSVATVTRPARQVQRSRSRSSPRGGRVDPGHAPAHAGPVLARTLEAPPPTRARSLAGSAASRFHPHRHGGLVFGPVAAQGTTRAYAAPGGWPETVTLPRPAARSPTATARRSRVLDGLMITANPTLTAPDAGPIATSSRAG